MCDSFHHNFIVDVSSFHILLLFLFSLYLYFVKRKREREKKSFNNFLNVKYEFRSDDICFVSYFFFYLLFIISWSPIYVTMCTMCALIISVGLKKCTWNVSSARVCTTGRAYACTKHCIRVCWRTSGVGLSKKTEKKKTNYPNLINEKIINKWTNEMYHLIMAQLNGWMVRLKAS